MADNLSISITADTTKLRADLAVAQAALRDFASEVRKAAAESLKTGDTSGVREAAANYEAAKSKVDGLSGALRASRSSVQEHASTFAELKASVSEFSGALGQLANNIFPHFREVLALSVGVAIVEFISKVKEANAEIREMENVANAIGITTDALEGLELVASKAGVGQDILARAFSISARRIGQVREETAKLTGQLPGSVSVLSGNMESVANSAIRVAGGVHQMNQSVFAQIATLRGGQKNVVDYGHAFDDLINDFQKFPATAEGNLRLQIAIAERITTTKDKTVAAALANKEYGRSWYESIAALPDLTKKLQAAQHQIEASNLSITDLDKANARNFNASLSVFEFYLGNVRKIAGAWIGQALIPVFDKMSEILADNADNIREWASEVGAGIANVLQDFIALSKGVDESHLKTGFVKDLVTVFSGLGEIIRGVVFVLRALAGVVDYVAQAINLAFGTHLTGGLIVGIALIGQFVGLWTFLGAAVGLADAAISAFVTGPLLKLLIPALTTIVGLIGWPATLIIGIGLAVGAIVGLIGNFDSLGGKIGEIITAIGEGKWGAAWKAAGDAATIVINGILGALQTVVDKLGEGLAKLGEFIGGSAFGGAGTTQTAAGPGGFASGGYVRGPGSGTSDSIRAWLSNGEFVVNAAATRANLPLLHAINSMRAPTAPRFALGGLVDAIGSIMPAPMRFASGGLVPASSGTPFTLVIDGNQFGGLHAPESTANNMVKFARKQRLLSAGPKPSWHAGRG